MTCDEMYEVIDSVWPLKRKATVRAIERQKLEELALTDEEFERLKNKIEILVEDTKDPRYLPGLVQLFSVPSRPAKRTVMSFVVEEPETSTDSRAEELFETLFAAWPQYDIPQNENTAKEAFLAAAKRRPIEDLEKACSLYVKEMADPAKASVRVLGIRRFVSEDVLQEWLDKAEHIAPPYDRSLFDAAYSWYPEFPQKSTEVTVADSLSFYRRFVVGEDAVRFYAAVKAYRDQRRGEVKALEHSGDLNGDRFTKRFTSFIRIWKQQECRDDLAILLEKPLLDALKCRGVKYSAVYPGEHFLSALKWFCSGEDKKVSKALTEMLEYICKHLTYGENHDSLVQKTEPDYSIVSEVIAGAMESAKKHNHFLKLEKNEDEED